MADRPHHLFHGEACLLGEVVAGLNGVLRIHGLADDAAEPGKQDGAERQGNQQFEQGEAAVTIAVVYRS